jgi:hypothetical protein
MTVLATKIVPTRGFVEVLAEIADELRLINEALAKRSPRVKA